MTGYSGALVLLKIKSGIEFITVGGMRTTKFSLNNKIIDATNKDSANWRELLPNAGISQVSITGNGIFTDSAAEKMIREIAFGTKMALFALYFANGDKLQGNFQITNYERIGNFNEEENYQITLESSGKISYS